MAATLALLYLLSTPLVMQGARRKKTVLKPICKVVTLLQVMQKKVIKEGEKEKKLYEKFMCYCKTNGGALDASISAANIKIPYQRVPDDPCEGLKFDDAHVTGVGRCT